MCNRNRRTIIGIIVIIMSLILMSNMPSSNMDIPNNFKSKEDFVTYGLDMTIYNNQSSQIGTIKQRTFNFTTTFDLNDKSGNKIATAKKQAFSWGTKINVYDKDNNKIGTLEEQIIESFFSLYSKYKIYDSKNNLIASSDKSDFFTSKIRIYGSGTEINIKKEHFTFTDTWNTTISKSSIDKRLIIFIPAYITYSQNLKKNK